MEGDRERTEVDFDRTAVGRDHERAIAGRVDREPGNQTCADWLGCGLVGPRRSGGDPVEPRRAARALRIDDDQPRRADAVRLGGKQDERLLTARDLQDGAVDLRTGNDAAGAGVDRKDGHSRVAAAAVDVREDPVGAHPHQRCGGPAQRNTAPEPSRARGREETERVLVPLGIPPDRESEEAAVGREGPDTAVAVQAEWPSGALERDRVETDERAASLRGHHPELDGLRRCGELEGSRPRRRHEGEEHEHARAGEATDPETPHVPITPEALPGFPGASYSTVTVLARLRGWSTFRPRRRPIRYASSCNGSTARTACRKAGVRGT